MDYFVVHGGKKLSGEITVNTSKNAAVALVMGSLINRGKTTLRNVPQIEEIERLIEVLESIGVKIERKGRHLTIIPPKRVALHKINRVAAMRTRSVIFLLPVLARFFKSYKIPQSGGCRLGARTVAPHAHTLEHFGINVTATRSDFSIKADFHVPERVIVLYESGDTVTENALFAAAQVPGKTEIHMASANYMVQDVCFFLQKLGVKIKGIGTTTLVVEGVQNIDKDITYEISEDPIEAMFFIATAITTKSELTIRRCPIEFLELELEKLRHMGLSFDVSQQYMSRNKKTRLVNITVYPSKLKALHEKIYGRPFPGINIDNVPFFAPIAAIAKGRTLIHDWVYENRSIYFTELARLGANVTLLDPHRVYIEGPTKLIAGEMMSPPALRPAAIILVAMLGAKGTSTLRNVYQINRGYENLTERLRAIGADIELVHKTCDQ